MAEQLFIIIIWAVLAIGVGLSARLLSTAMLNKTVRAALRDHPRSSAALLEKIGERQSWPDNLLGVGMIGGATGLAALALLERPSDRYATLEAAFLLAMIGAAVLFLAQAQRDAMRTLVIQQARETPDLLHAARASFDTEPQWADAVLMVMVAAIALAFTILTLVAYWDDYPAIVVGGILASLAIAAAVLHRRRKASERSD